jgi:hypothetical protein
MQSLVDGAVDIAKSLPGLAKNAMKGLVDSVKSVFGDALAKAQEIWGKAKDLYERAKEKFNEGQKKYKSADGGVVPAYFNTGGMVYAASGYFSKGQDTVPAMLSPGEMVLNKSQQGNLFNMLNGRAQAQGGGGATVNINVGYMVASRGEQREFARKIKQYLEEDSNRY